ncbi:hypothetical protein B0H16DRAFT_1831319 [Mycena metata]|uniref:Uncharacterized protein n=1 Tax=Mycena metata TaxID=1033252 RepID=A0AAD7E170_9AGAR|nr:hypothetical protein B0H16DRAFT_1831319 [Mycena metata]
MIGRGTVRVVRILGRRRKKENLKGVNSANPDADGPQSQGHDARILENSMMRGFREVSERNGANAPIHLRTSLVGKRLEGDAVGKRTFAKSLTEKLGILFAESGPTLLVHREAVKTFTFQERGLKEMQWESEGKGPTCGILAQPRRLLRLRVFKLTPRVFELTPRKHMDMGVSSTHTASREGRPEIRTAEVVADGVTRDPIPDDGIRATAEGDKIQMQTTSSVPQSESPFVKIAHESLVGFIHST